MSKASQQLTGMAILGQLMNPAGPSTKGILMSMILNGEYDEQLTAAFEGAHPGKSGALLASLKDQIREAIKYGIELLLEQHDANVRELIQLRNQPHKAGTTAELAQMLGISKKQVRKLRASGKLDAALEELNHA